MKLLVKLFIFFVFILLLSGELLACDLSNSALFPFDNDGQRNDTVKYSQENLTIHWNISFR